MLTQYHSQNFMKTLMQYFADKGQGVVFFESAYNHFKGQRHTWIECVPVPFELFDVLPGYFAVSCAVAPWLNSPRALESAQKT